MHNNEKNIEMLKKMQLGDEAAFQYIYETYYNYVYFIGIKYIGNVHDAEDLTQEVFIKIYKNINSLKNLSAFNTWIWNIAMNHYKMKLRKGSSKKNKVEEVNLDTTEEAHLGIEEKHLPENMLIDNEYKTMLSALINKLSKKQKAVVLLYYFEAHTIGDIAKHLATSENAVKNALFKGRKNLKKLINETFELEKQVSFFGTWLAGLAFGFTDRWEDFRNLTAKFFSRVSMDFLETASAIFEKKSAIALMGTATGLVMVTGGFISNQTDSMPVEMASTMEIADNRGQISGFVFEDLPLESGETINSLAEMPEAQIEEKSEVDFEAVVEKKAVEGKNSNGFSGSSMPVPGSQLCKNPMTLNVEDLIIDVGTPIDDALLKSKIEALDGNGKDIADKVEVYAGFELTHYPNISAVIFTLADEDGEVIKKQVNLVVIPEGDVVEEDKPYVYAPDKKVTHGTEINQDYILAGAFAYDRTDGDLTSNIQTSKVYLPSKYHFRQSVDYSVTNSNGYEGSTQAVFTKKRS